MLGQLSTETPSVDGVKYDLSLRVPGDVVRRTVIVVRGRCGGGGGSVEWEHSKVLRVNGAVVRYPMPVHAVRCIWRERDALALHRHGSDGGCGGASCDCKEGGGDRNELHGSLGDGGVAGKEFINRVAWRLVSEASVCLHCLQRKTELRITNNDDICTAMNHHDARLRGGHGVSMFSPRRWPKRNNSERL